ncbi:MAG: Glu/Leu/Phe/Val dehydrogenase dimerization domain-containing protein [Gaiellaceae bacterium]
MAEGRTPARIIELRDAVAGLDAVVVVDHELFPVSAGGTRMIPDVDSGEVARLARAMTWKFASCRLPYAGAKAGVRFAGGDRAAVLAAYLRALEPLGETFLTGPDMGTYPADFVEDPDAELPLWAQSYQGMGMDDLATGHGVKAAAEAALVRLGRSLEGAAVAIEGFGKVGAGTARACARGGARVVGISTAEGSIADPGGFDVEALLDLRSRHGDALVRHAAVPLWPRENLFAFECDVVVPGARPDSVTPGVVERLRCAVVAPGANAPYASGALEALHARGIVALPDFVANSGGVHLYESLQPGDDAPAALARIEAIVAEMTVRILDAARADGVTPMAAALADGRRWLLETVPSGADLVEELFPAP